MRTGKMMMPKNILAKHQFIHNTAGQMSAAENTVSWYGIECGRNGADVVQAFRWVSNQAATAALTPNLIGVMYNCYTTWELRNVTVGRVRIAVWKCRPRIDYPKYNALGAINPTIDGANPALLTAGFTDQGTANQATGTIAYTTNGATPYMSRSWVSNFKLGKPVFKVLQPGECWHWKIKQPPVKINTASKGDVASDGTNSMTFNWYCDRKWLQCCYLIRFMGELGTTSVQTGVGFSKAELVYNKTQHFTLAAAIDNTSATGIFSEPTYATAIYGVEKPAATLAAVS